MHTTFKLALGTAAILAAFGASAQTFPAAGKSITIVVPFAAGGPTDTVTRLNRALLATLAVPAFRDQLEKQGL